MMALDTAPIVEVLSDIKNNGLALPDGGATEEKQDIEIAKLEAIRVLVDVLSGSKSVDDVWDKIEDVRALLAGTITTNATPQPTENHLGEVGGKLRGSAASFTRPADTTAYAAKDAVSNSTLSTTIMEFDLARVAGGTGYIIKARLHTSQSTCTSRFRLWLFNVNNPTLAVDNAAYALKDTDKTKSIGYIDFAACSTEGTGSDTALALATSSTGTTMPLSFECAAGDTKLYGLLETLDAFTPANAQTFWIRLTADCN